jgi:STE24 endopeptidase
MNQEQHVWFSYFFIVALIGAISLQLWLIARQKNHVSKYSDTVPEAFANKISLEAHQKAANYTIAKLQVGKIELIYSSIILLLWTFAGGLNMLDQFWFTQLGETLWYGVAVMISFIIIGIFLDLPFGIYRTFIVEEKFGFNKMTSGLYIKDFLVGIVVNLIIVTPLLWLTLWLMQTAGSLWWLYVWAVLVVFMLLMMFIYPTVIAPLFNKFTPLENNDLKQRIEALLSRCGFASKGIFVMDGSKRSSHGNAYFTGFGQNKRIVFFDTLIDSLEPQEIEAVLAHELGHFKHKHIRKQMLIMSILTLGALALLGWLMQQSWFYTGLGIETQSTHMALILFMLVLSIFGIYFQPVFAFLSRKNEFEADDFASKQSNAGDLIQALVKLYKENANTLTPDPLYSSFHDSHPPAPVRVAYLSSKLRTE